MGEGLLVEYTRLWNGFKRGLLQYLEDNRAELRDPSISHSYYDTFSDQLSATRKKLIELELGNPNVYNALERIAVGATKNPRDCSLDKLLVVRNSIDRITIMLSERDVKQIEQELSQLESAIEPPSDGPPIP